MRVLRLPKSEPPTRCPEDRRHHRPIEVGNLLDWKAHGDGRRDDRAGRGAADEIEIVAESELASVAESLAKQAFHCGQIGQRNDASHAAAVEREEALGSRAE